jgi:hypothetical protein
VTGKNSRGGLSLTFGALYVSILSPVLIVKNQVRMAFQMPTPRLYLLVPHWTELKTQKLLLEPRYRTL